jgi:hypothetical protein
MSTTTRDPFNPAVPAGAYDDLLARALPQARAQRVLTLGAATDPTAPITTAIEATRFGNSIRSIQIA